ncbi:TorF family putative porin [Novosphingobium sp.]|uniref:TorF family putative porin n=1 Tax=Novosphingobium sp. TaxID=1874826 RepID=UPI0031D87304
MKIKFACAAAALAVAFASNVAFADDAPAPTPDFTVTGSAAIVSQYRFRGISQSDNKATGQASITLSHKSGFYVATWASGATAGNSTVNIGGSEIDVYGGYTHAIGKTGLTFDGGLYGYLYPGNDLNEYYELYGSLTKAYGPITAKAGLNWAPKQSYFTYWNTATKYNMYEYFELGLAVPKTPITVHAHIGHTGGGFNYVKEYLDYTAGVSYKWKNLTLDLSAVGTNIGKSDAFKAPLTDQTGTPNPDQTFRAAKSVAVLSLTASF